MDKNNIRCDRIIDKERENPIIELNVEEILIKVGVFGRFQKIVDGIFCYAFLFISLQGLIMFFATLTPPWKCTSNSTACLLNETRLATDRRRCDMSRNEWYYTEPKHFSLVTEFSIDCDREWLRQVVSSIHFVGLFLGAISSSWTGDKFGRKTLMLPSAAIMLVVGLISSFLPNIYLIIVCRSIIGFVIPNVLAGSTVLLSELVGNTHRPIATLIPFFFLPIGLSVTALKSYLLQRWDYLSIACTAPYILFLPIYCFIPESPKWLHAKGRLDDAYKVFERMAKWNKKELVSNIILLPYNKQAVNQNSNTEETRGNTCDRIVLQTIVLSFIWFVTNVLYMGMQIAAGELKGSLYTNFVLVAMVEIPGIIISIIACKRLGRKITILISLVLTGSSCIAIALIPAEGKFTITRVTIAIFGKFFTTICNQSLFVWSNEIFPTHIRSRGMSIVLAIGRLGTASSPWIAQGLSPFGASVPFIVMGAPALFAFLLGLWLPDTKEK